jgi:hypothetical protein
MYAKAWNFGRGLPAHCLFEMVCERAKMVCKDWDTAVWTAGRKKRLDLIDTSCLEFGETSDSILNRWQGEESAERLPRVFPDNATC